MLKSDSIANLAAALAAAQGQMEGAKKDAANPFFKSKYADLASVWEAIRKPLSANGLAVLQFPRATDGGVEVETVISHASGEWMAETLWMPVSKSDAQGVGSAITYARRYGLAAVTGVAPEDDDGNAAAASVKHQKTNGNALREKWLAILRAEVPNGLAALQEVWKGMRHEEREAVRNEMPALKEEASHAAPV